MDRHSALYEHFHNPVYASVDIISVSTIASYWAGYIHDMLTPTLATLSLGLSAMWYAYCLYDAIEKRVKK